MFGQEMAERDSDDRPLVVRHVPIVIERGDGDDNNDDKADTSDIVIIPASSGVGDDMSSLSSMSSENSVETARKRDKVERVEEGGLGGRGGENRRDTEYYSWDDWRERRKMSLGERAGGEDTGRRAEHKETRQFQVKPDRRSQGITRWSSQGHGPWYLLRTETVGVKSCPVHGEGEGGKANKKPLTSSHGLSTPAMLASLPGNKTSTLEPGRRPKHHSLPAKPGASSGTPSLSRGPGQWSVRGRQSSDQNKTVRDRNQDQKNSNGGFQRRWSFRASSLTPNKTPQDSSSNMSFQAPTIASLSRCVAGPVPEYFRLSGAPEEQETSEPIRKYSSQGDLNSHTSTTLFAHQKSHNLKTSPSISATSIPSKVSPDRESECSSKDSYPPTGILKTPGKRKVSSNNRVEFLSNIMEREIPGRYT